MVDKTWLRLRFLVVHSSQLAHQTAVAYAAAQAKEAERLAEHVQHVAARWFACAADAEEAIADYAGRGQGGGAVPRVPGAIMPSTIASKRSVSPRNGPGEAVRRRPRCPRSRSAIAWW